MSTLIDQLEFTPAAALPASLDFKLMLGSASSDFYHFKVHGELADPTSETTVLYAFHEGQCIARICPRHPKVSIGDKILRRRGKGAGRFVDWIPVFGLPEKFSISLYAGEMGRYGQGNNVFQGNSLEDCTYLGEITGCKEFIACEDSEYLPVRLSCFGRSGSSLMMRYLSFHPQIAVAGQHPFEFNVADHYFRRCRMNAYNSQDYFAHNVQQSRKRSRNPWYQYEQVNWMGGHAETFFGREQIRREIEFCRQSSVDFYRGVKLPGAKGQMYFCEKDGSGRSGFDELKEIWPGARRIYLVRDFRDNCASILAYCARKGTREFGLQFFDTEEQWLLMLSQKARGLLTTYQQNDPHTSFVMYEKLLDSEFQTLTELLESMGLDSSAEVVDSMIQEAKKLDSSDKVARHATSGDVNQSIGRWREDLPSHLVAIIEREFNDVMSGFGYQRDV